MRPQPNDFNRVDFFKSMIHQTMLYVYSAGTCASQIPNQFRQRGRILIWILLQNLEQSLRFGL